MTDLSLTVKISFILLGLGFILHFIAFASPYWHNGEIEIRGLVHYNVHYGLWRSCTDQRISSKTIKHCVDIVSADYVAGKLMTAFNHVLYVAIIFLCYTCIVNPIKP